MIHYKKELGLNDYLCLVNNSYVDVDDELCDFW